MAANLVHVEVIVMMVLPSAHYVEGENSLIIVKAQRARTALQGTVVSMDIIIVQCARQVPIHLLFLVVIACNALLAVTAVILVQRSVWGAHKAKQALREPQALTNVSSTPSLS